MNRRAISNLVAGFAAIEWEPNPKPDRVHEWESDLEPDRVHAWKPD